MKRILKQILIIMLALISAALVLFVLIISWEETPPIIEYTNSNVKNHEVSYFDCETRGDTITSFTYNINDIVYPIYINPKVDCYITRTSENGIQYKHFLPEELCLQICAELNIEYQK